MRRFLDIAALAFATQRRLCSSTMKPRPVAAPLVPLSLLAVSVVGDGVSPWKEIGLDKLREDLTARLENAPHGGDAE